MYNLQLIKIISTKVSYKNTLQKEKKPCGMELIL